MAVNGSSTRANPEKNSQLPYKVVLGDMNWVANVETHDLLRSEWNQFQGLVRRYGRVNIVQRIGQIEDISAQNVTINQIPHSCVPDRIRGERGARRRARESKSGTTRFRV